MLCSIVSRAAHLKMRTAALDAVPPQRPAATMKPIDPESVSTSPAAAGARTHASGQAPERAVNQGPAQPLAIDIRGLSLTFQTDDTPMSALSEIDLTVRHGEFVAFIGPS